MKNFKYKITVSGSKENLSKFWSELLRMGYSSGRNEFNGENNYTITVNYANYDRKIIKPGLINYFSNPYSDWVKNPEYCIDYSFQINNQNEFDAALAIAAITNDLNYNIGEIILAIKDSNDIMTDIKKGDLYLITDIQKEFRSNITENWYYYKRINRKGEKKLSSFSEGSNFKNAMSCKASVDEILNFYNISNINQNPNIGYKCPTDLFNGKVKKGTIFKKYITNIGYSTTKEHWESCGGVSPYNLPNEIVEQWEKVEDIKTINVTCGNNNVKFDITSNSDIIKVTSKYGPEIYPIKDVEEILKIVLHSPILLHQHTACIDNNIRFIRVGCEEHNNLFSIDDLKMVWDTWKKLNE